MWQGQSLPPWRNTRSLSSLRWITTGCMVLHPAVWLYWLKVTLPAGMMPIWSEQGCKAAEGSFSQTPASCWVRPIKPCSISLNMPSPPTHTTLEMRKNSTCKGSIFLLGLYESATSQLLTHQNQSGLSSGGGLWPGLPAQSLNNRCEEHLQAVWRSIFTLLSVTYLSRESWYQPAQTEGPPAKRKSSVLSSCLQTG